MALFLLIIGVLSNVGVDDVSSITLRDGAGSSCTLGCLYRGFLPWLWMFFFFMLPEFSAVMLKIVSNLLNWLIPLLSLVIFNFPFSVFVICCDTCTTAYLGATLVFVMYL